MPPIPESDRCLWASLPNQSTALGAERHRTSLLERGVGREATDVKAKAANAGDSAARGLRPRPHAEGKPRCPGGGHKAPTTRPPLPTPGLTQGLPAARLGLRQRRRLSQNRQTFRAPPPPRLPPDLTAGSSAGQEGR